MAKKILIVDDEFDFCFLLKKRLERAGHTVRIKHTVQEGIKQMDTYSPDILLLDNDLPDGQGWPAAKYFIEKKNDVVLVFISAYSNRSQVPEFARYANYIEKPFDFYNFERFLERPE